MISLVVATLDRIAELERLLTSLDRQTFQDFEVLVIDQNTDGRLLPVLAKHGNLTIKHLRSGRGLSRARNVGLQVAKGDIVAIPDDDCWYPEHLLTKVDEWFKGHLEYDALLGIMRTAENRPILPRWAPDACRCVKKNVWDCVVSNTAFLRRSVVQAVGPFNENLGVGASTLFQAGEECDYILRALGCGFRVWYEPGIFVHHPDMRSVARLRRTSYSYALAMGYVMRFHRYSWWYLTTRVLRSLGGAGLNLLKADSSRMRIHLERAAGQLRGYVLGSRDLRRSTAAR
jgi:glycosyltransferase involved in cell wall biosynthesis